MSWTPPNEEIDETLTTLLKERLADLLSKLNNRITVNGGDWNGEHIEKCITLRNDLEKSLLYLNEFLK